jgi:hypothetical protein
VLCVGSQRNAFARTPLGKGEDRVNAGEAYEIGLVDEGDAPRGAIGDLNQVDHGCTLLDDGELLEGLFVDVEAAREAKGAQAIRPLQHDDDEPAPRADAVEQTASTNIECGVREEKRRGEVGELLV